MEHYMVGIDFGASSIKAVKSEDKRLKVIALDKTDGDRPALFNTIAYRPIKDSQEVQTMVGVTAYRYGVAKPENAVMWIKRKLLRHDWVQYIDALGKNITAWDATRDIFDKIKKKIFVKLETDTEIQAVLTVPVNYSILQRKHLKAVVEQTGITVEHIITEPFAALFALKDLTKMVEEIIFVFDFGASTLDVSIIQVDSGKTFIVKEIGAAGIKLGGLDLDEAIARKIIEVNYKAEIDEYFAGLVKDNDGDEDLARRRLDMEVMRCARDIKEQIFGENDDESENNVFTIDVIVTREQIIELFERERYRACIVDMLDELFEDTMIESCIDKSAVTRIAPFGGTSKIDYFIDILSEYFDGTDIKDFSFDDNDDLCKGLEDRYMAVAGGAALYKRHLDSGKSVVIENAIPFRIGIEWNDKFVSFINKNAPNSFKSNNVLTFDGLNKYGWTLKFYQSFTADKTEIGSDKNDEGAVYIGSLDLDRQLYAPADVSMEMAVLNAATLQCRFYQLQVIDGEPESVMIEEKIFSIG